MLKAWKKRAAALLQWTLDFVSGYDFFIAYTWADGRTYAHELYKELRRQGFECFWDRTSFEVGDNLKLASRRALHKTSYLIVVASPRIFESDHVLREVKIFRRTKRRIIPINFGRTLDPQQQDDHPLFRVLNTESLLINERMSSLPDGPSRRAVRQIRDTFDHLRQSQKRLRLLAAAVVVFALMTVASVLLGGCVLAC